MELLLSREQKEQKVILISGWSHKLKKMEIIMMIMVIIAVIITIIIIMGIMVIIMGIIEMVGIIL